MHPVGASAPRDWWVHPAVIFGCQSCCRDWLHAGPYRLSPRQHGRQGDGYCLCVDAADLYTGEKL